MLKATYSSGKQATIDNNTVKVTNFDRNSLGNQTVILSLDNGTLPISIEVVDIDLRIEVCGNFKSNLYPKFSIFFFTNFVCHYNFSLI